MSHENRGIVALESCIAEEDLAMAVRLHLEDMGRLEAIE